MLPEPNIYRYKHYKASLGYAIINTNTCTCTCSGYFDKGVCKHLVAACIRDNIPLNGLKVFPNKLKILRRRLKKKNLDTSIYDFL